MLSRRTIKALKLILVTLSILFTPIISWGQTGITAATGSIINEYAAVINISGSTITLDSSNAFIVGDTALLIQMKGSTVSRIDDSSHGDVLSYGSAGRFEFVEITGVNSGSVTLGNSPVVAFQTAGTVQLIRVASYVDSTLTGTISATPWNGTKGGVVAIDASGTLTLAGTIDVTGLGFQGGSLVNNIPFDSCVSDLTNYTGPASNGSGNKGEGIVASQASHLAMRGHNANGGGGGNITDAAGGGGGNFGAGGIGGRELDICDDGSHGGLGGQALNYTPMNRVFMGGGGGSGSEVAQVAKGGARGGGGIVVIRANSLVTSGGSILANGLTSNDDDGNGADGGGAGGSVALVVKNGISGLLPIQSDGGNGGNESNPTNAHGPGGGGGGGGVLLNGPSCNNIDWSTNGGSPGVSLIGTAKGDPNWGAESGQQGQCVEDFTEIPHVSQKSGISGKIFQDDNSNDIFDPTELGLANISVWVQLINADGTVDPVKSFASADALGNYQFNNLADGNYQVHVDTSDPDLPSDVVPGGSNPLIVSIAGIAVTDADFPFDEVVCTAFTGEVSALGIPIYSQLKTSDKLFLPSSNISPVAGHLRAYSIDNDGQPSTTEAWDAASKMDTTKRTNKLYSTDTNGNKVLFNALDDAAFVAASLPITTIKEFTITPSAAGGQYLSGRENGSFLGNISKGNDIDILSNKLNTSLYLHDQDYRDFYTNTVANRNQRVLMTSDDGFLYAFNYNTGNLSWGWMPRSLVSELNNYTNFQSKQLMNGSVDVLDLKTNSGVYGSYIVGSYKNGLGHYVLKVNATGGFAKVIWDEDLSANFVSAPNNGKMEFFRDGNGKVYGANVVTDSAGTSKLLIRTLVDTSENMVVNLTYEATSSPFVMQDYQKSNAPTAKTLYLGTSTGDIHSALLLDTDGDLLSKTFLEGKLQDSSVTTMDDNSTDAVLHLGASVSAKDNRYYLTSQTETRLTVHRYSASNDSWGKAWTSFSTGAGAWDDSGTYSNDSSGVPSDKGGFAIIPPTGIQSLPANASIDAAATIVGDSIILPISAIDSSSSSCYGKAYYYLYSLSDGKFPSTSFYNNDNTAMDTNIALGYGEAKKISITDLSGTDNLMAYGVADKKVDLSAGIATSFIIKDPVTSGIRGWKEIGR